MRRVLSLLLLLTAADAFASDGTTGASSLKLASGARGQGLGEAFVAVADGADAMAWNPAGLVNGPAGSIFAAFQPMAEKVSVSQMGGAAHFGHFAAGAGYGAVSAASLDAIDTVGNKTGSFSAKDQTFMAAGAFGGPAFSAGITGKYWKSDIDGESASAAMADAGIAFQNPFFSAVRHGFVIRHLGPAVSYVSQKDPLPMTIAFGSAIRASHRLLLSGDYGVERGAGGYFAAGAEWSAVTLENFGLALRGGYNSRRKDAGSLSGAAIGAGISWRAVSLDYAWVPFGDIGDVHAITLRMTFGEARDRGFRSASERPTLGSGTSMVPVSVVKPAASASLAPEGAVPASPAAKTPQPSLSESSAVQPSAQTAPSVKSKVKRKKYTRSQSHTLESVSPR